MRVVSAVLKANDSTACDNVQKDGLNNLRDVCFAVDGPADSAAIAQHMLQGPNLSLASYVAL